MISLFQFALNSERQKIANTQRNVRTERKRAKHLKPSQNMMISGSQPFQCYILHTAKSFPAQTSKWKFESVIDSKCAQGKGDQNLSALDCQVPFCLNCPQTSPTLATGTEREKEAALNYSHFYKKLNKLFTFLWALQCNLYLALLFCQHLNHLTPHIHQYVKEF